MIKTGVLLSVFCLVSASAWAADYTVYSWHPVAKIAVRAGQGKSFADARQTADVLSALNSIKGAPQMDSEFSMISDVNEPLTTWVVQTAEPFQPHEYFWVGDKKDSNRSER